MLSRAMALLWLKVLDAVASQVMTVAQTQRPKCCDDLRRDESPRDCDCVFSQVITVGVRCFRAVTIQVVTVAIIPSGDFTIR